jgi:multidrug efflux pump subunit AcrA (membrane-fusion protein)
MSTSSYSSIKKLSETGATSVGRVGLTWVVPLMAYSLITLLFLIILALIFVPWVQTVPGVGKVIGYLADDRQQEIQAPVDGRILKWHVIEGSRVKVGEPIVDIVDLDPQIIDRLTQEKDAAKIKLESAIISRDTSLKNLERQQALSNKGLSSLRALELAQIEYQKFLSEVSTATAELTRIESRLSRQANQTITAPRDGIIMRIIAPQGEGILVKAGAPLARLVPETDELAVEVKIRGNDMPLVSEGREVRLQFEGWPAIQFAGWPNVAVGTFAGVVKVVDASDDGTGNFRIIVVPNERKDWPEYPYLRQGVRAHGWVLLDSVSIGWELWRQLNGFPPSVKDVPLKSEKN